MQLTGLALVAAMASAGPATAEFSTVSDRNSFVKLVKGKALTRPLVRLTVNSDGSITGKGAARPVSGAWTWKDGYFCRDLYWGDRDLGYNCQQVQASRDRIRFTSDRGRGDYADFRLR